MTYVRLAMAVAGLAALIGAFFFGRGTGVDHQKAVDQKVMAKALKAIERGRAAIDILNGRVADAQRDRTTESGSIRNAAAPIILRPIYNSVCVDADGGRLLDRAAANANRGLAGEPAGAAADAPADPESR